MPGTAIVASAMSDDLSKRALGKGEANGMRLLIFWSRLRLGWLDEFEYSYRAKLRLACSGEKASSNTQC